MLNKLPKLILIGVVSLIGLAFFIDTFMFSSKSVSEFHIVTSLTLRRNFIVPGFLSGHYFQFFSENPKALMSTHKVVVALFDVYTPYTTNPSKIIGQKVFGSNLMNANVNILADAYGNFGFIGMIVTSLIFFVYLLLFDLASKNVDLRLSFSLLIGPLVFFSNSSILTALMGHGAMWALILVFLYKISFNNK